MTKLAINGFGRIGRVFFRQISKTSDFSVVAINDLGERENLEYLLKYDTVYGKFEHDLNFVDGPSFAKASEGGKNVLIFSEKDPSKLPWKDFGIDIVIESTGVFETSEKAKAHLDAGAKHVVITAPAKDDVTQVMTPNVGWQSIASGEKLGSITSNASCTTNCVNPVVSVMMEGIGIKKAMLNTVHAYTATQSIVDGPGGKDFRRGRAAAQNIVPSTTGAAKATTKVIKELEGKFDGIAIRVPVPAGSIIDLTFVSDRPTTVEEINEIFRKAALNPQWEGILQVTDEQLVSSDILGNHHGAVVDLKLTRVVDGDLVKVFAWYDNEWGYCSMLIKHLQEVVKLL